MEFQPLCSEWRLCRKATNRRFLSPRYTARNTLLRPKLCLQPIRLIPCNFVFPVYWQNCYLQGLHTKQSYTVCCLCACYLPSSMTTLPNHLRFEVFTPGITKRATRHLRSQDLEVNVATTSVDLRICPLSRTCVIRSASRIRCWAALPARAGNEPAFSNKPKY